MMTPDVSLDFVFCFAVKTVEMVPIINKNDNLIVGAVKDKCIGATGNDEMLVQSRILVELFRVHFYQV